MNNKKIERFIIQIILSLLTGILFSATFYGIYKHSGILIEIGSVISKGISIFVAVIIGFLTKRYVDYQDKIKDLKLDSKAPSSVVAKFEAQKDEYFRISYFAKINVIYLSVGAFMVVASLVMPLEKIKPAVETGIFIIFDAGFTSSTIFFLLCISYEIVRKTQEARNVKTHFDKTIEVERERQNLIANLNKKIREQRDADKKDHVMLRENKEFDLRGYIASLKKDKDEE